MPRPGHREFGDICLLELRGLSVHHRDVRYRPDVHHRRSLRLPTYDYRENGAYFVTICTHERQCILDNDPFRHLLARAWAATVGTSIAPGDGEFVIMPNHVHGMVWLDGGASGARHQAASGDHDSIDDQSVIGESSALPPASPLRRFTAPASGSLGAIVASFKSLTARCINRARGTPGAPVWQRNYYEHIIREEGDLLRIFEYIRDNPAKWAEDPYNPANQIQQTHPR
jgi:REP element-mobilizing transposase RayT